MPEALIKVIKIIFKLPSQVVLYGLSLLALASLSGVHIPETLVPFAASIGVNLLSNMLERLANGENIKEDEIKRILDETIGKLNLDQLPTEKEFYKVVRKMFKQFNLLDYAIEKNEIKIIQAISQLETSLEIIEEDIKIIDSKTEKILKILEGQTQVLVENIAISQRKYPQNLVDQEVRNEIEKLRKCRFIIEFDRSQFSHSLAEKIVSGEYSGASFTEKANALAWCSRVLYQNQLEKAEEYLELAYKFGTTDHTTIAKAFIYSTKGDKNTALSTLRNLHTPESYSAALMIIINHGGVEEGIDWLNKTQLDVNQLDSDGKYFLLANYINTSNWELAFEGINNLINEDFLKTPILYHIKAMILLLYSVPQEYRMIILNYIPLDGRNFPLSAMTRDINYRREAYDIFKLASNEFRNLGLRKISLVCEDYALWIKLNDPETVITGINELKNKLENLESGLRYVNLGFKFGLMIDIDQVETEIDRQIALNGGSTPESALARLAISFRQDSPIKNANYFKLHKHEFEHYFDPQWIFILEIEVLIKAGMIVEAKELFSENSAQDKISENDKKIIEGIFSEVQGSDPIEIKKHNYLDSHSLDDLWILVDELLKNERWGELCDFGFELFEKTHDMRSTEIYVRALQKTNRVEKAYQFLRNNYEITKQSQNLMFQFIWLLYQNGMIEDALKELSTLTKNIDDPNYKKLKITLAIASGNWIELEEVISFEYSNHENRNARELLEAAQIGLQIKSTKSKELIYFAAEKGLNDPEILLNCYLLAAKAGFENEPKAIGWLNRAANLSNENGPMKKMTVKEIVEEAPFWYEHESDTLTKLQQIEMPLFLVAQYLNKSLINLTSMNAYINQDTLDPRRRVAIPAFSGKRSQNVLQPDNNLGIDITTLLNLEYLDLLEKTIDLFTLVIPHFTLEWFFEESQKITFHQSKLLEDAQNVIDLIGEQKISIVNESTLPESDLVYQIGKELASLLAEAKYRHGNDNNQHLVVRSRPIHLINSFLDEEADMSTFSEYLCSCQSLVDYLFTRGYLFENDREKASSYLYFIEKPWPKQPEIMEGAFLLLDSLSVSYLLNLGLLGKLSDAGFRIQISKEKFLESRDLKNYRIYSNQILNSIDKINRIINKGLLSGRIRIGKAQTTFENNPSNQKNHPSVNLFALVGECDAIIIDDRFFNQNKNIKSQDKETPIYSSLDIIKTLYENEIININVRNDSLIKLRNSGYISIPIEIEELIKALECSNIIDGILLETAGLKFIRQNFYQVKMGNWLKIPDELVWIENTIKNLNNTLINLWNSEDDVQKLIIKSDLIYSLLDIRGWVCKLSPEINTEIFNNIYGINILSVIISVYQINDKNQIQFINWVEKKIINPLKIDYPEVFSWVVENFKLKVVELTKLQVPQSYVENLDPLVIPKFIAQFILNKTPKSLEQALIIDGTLFRELNLPIKTTICFQEPDVEFFQEEFYQSINSVVSGEQNLTINDLNGNHWQLSKSTLEYGLSTVKIENDSDEILINFASLLSSNPDLRRKYLNEYKNDIYISDNEISNWDDIVSSRLLKIEELDILLLELSNTPITEERKIQEVLTSSLIEIDELIPHSTQYYEKLIGCYDGSLTIKDYAQKTVKPLIRNLIQKKPAQGALCSLYLSAHSSITETMNLDNIGIENIQKIYDFIIKHGDRTSQIGAIEIGFRMISDYPELEPILVNLIKSIYEENLSQQTDGFYLLSALFIFVDGELSKKQFFKSKPPFYRRLASISHSSLLFRQILGAGLSSIKFCNWLISGKYRFFLQSWVDMRLEPRWEPDLSEAFQLKTEFLSRIRNVSIKYKEKIKSDELRELVSLLINDVFISPLDFLQSILPGPLEGNLLENHNLPKKFEKVIMDQLENEIISPDSFFALSNSARIFSINTRLVDFAVETIKRSNYHISNINDREQVLNMMYGLSSVSAVCRNTVLANEVKKLTRQLRNDPQINLSILEILRICLVSAASFEKINDWRLFIGEWVVEIALYDLEDDEGKDLLNSLDTLMQIDPGLWFTCGKAEATLEKYIKI